MTTPPSPSLRRSPRPGPPAATAAVPAPCRGVPLRRAGIALLAGTALALGPAALPLTGPLGVFAGGAVPAAQAAPAPGGPLLVTEIAPDTVGADEFEFLELTNTSTEPEIGRAHV